MSKKIGEIKEELANIQEHELSEFINNYMSDERSGVIKLVERASKKLQAYEAELERLEMIKKFERQYNDCEFICGIDEVGRGPLAGPVVAGAVILPKDCNILYINDSKKLSEKKRELLYDQIIKEAGCMVDRPCFASSN